MIRFGKYLQQSWAHPAQESDTFRSEILNANPRLSQNPYYN